MVGELSNRIPRRQALDTPLLGYDALVARYDERSGVRGHGAPKAAAIVPRKHLALGVPYSTPEKEKRTPFGGSFSSLAAIVLPVPSTNSRNTRLFALNRAGGLDSK